MRQIIRGGRSGRRSAKFYLSCVSQVTAKAGVDNASVIRRLTKTVVGILKLGIRFLCCPNGWHFVDCMPRPSPQFGRGFFQKILLQAGFHAPHVNRRPWCATSAFHTRLLLFGSMHFWRVSRLRSGYTWLCLALCVIAGAPAVAPRTSCSGRFFAGSASPVRHHTTDTTIG